LQALAIWLRADSDGKGLQASLAAVGVNRRMHPSPPSL